MLNVLSHNALSFVNLTDTYINFSYIEIDTRVNETQIVKKT